MPIYEYQCRSCNHQMEEFQNMGDPALKECPACKKQELQKLVSAASFHLKGDGWYVTDFRDKNKQGKKDKKSTDSAEKGVEKEKKETVKKEVEKSSKKSKETSGGEK